jgi:hypothetical protein
MIDIDPDALHAEIIATEGRADIKALLARYGLTNGEAVNVICNAASDKQNGEPLGAEHIDWMVPLMTKLLWQFEVDE